MIIHRPKPKPGRRNILPRLRPDPYPSHVVPLVLPRPHRTAVVPSLPNELIGHIIHLVRDFVHDHDAVVARVDRQTLRSCCLVATSFLQPARVALYRRVGVYPWSKDGSCRLFQTLLENPRLATLVHTLDIKVCVSDDKSLDHLVAGGPSTSTLGRTLQACRNVVNISLQVAESPECQAALDTLATSAPLLHSFSIVILGEPSRGIEQEYLRLLHGQPRLKSFVTSCGVPTTWSTERLAAQLDHLNISGLDNAFPSFHVPLFETLAASSHSSLRSLSLPYFHRGHPPPTLTQFTQLASLTLDILPPAASFLAQLSLLPLRDLSIYADGDPFNTPPLSLLLAALPPTLQSLDYLSVHPLISADIISFLDSDRCPRLESLELFPADGGPTSFSPFEQTAIAAACGRHGLVLEQDDPQEDESGDEAEESDEGES